MGPGYGFGELDQRWWWCGQRHKKGSLLGQTFEQFVADGKFLQLPPVLALLETTFDQWEVNVHCAYRVPPVGQRGGLFVDGRIPVQLGDDDGLAPQVDTVAGRPCGQHQYSTLVWPELKAATASSHFWEPMAP